MVPSNCIYKVFVNIYNVHVYQPFDLYRYHFEVI